MPAGCSGEGEIVGADRLIRSLRGGVDAVKSVPESRLRQILWGDAKGPCWMEEEVRTVPDPAFQELRGSRRTRISRRRRGSRDRHRLNAILTFPAGIP